MVFKRKILQPDYDRRPYFDGYETDQAGHQFECINCGNILNTLFKEILNAAYGWDEDLSTSEKEQISEHFSLNAVGKSHDGGWPSILRKKCERCGTAYFFYFGLNEYHHSTYKIVLQGVSQLET